MQRVLGVVTLNGGQSICSRPLANANNSRIPALVCGPQDLQQQHQQATADLASTKASLAKSEEARVRAEVRPRARAKGARGRACRQTKAGAPLAPELTAPHMAAHPQPTAGI